MSTAANEIWKRHAKRAGILKDSRKPLKVVITDAEHVSEAKKLITKQQADLLDACHLVDHDVQVLRLALDLMQDEHPGLVSDNYVGRAWEKIALSDEDQAVLYERAAKEAEEREKEYKKGGKTPEVDGQQKMFDPSKMPAAEAASDCVTKKID